MLALEFRFDEKLLIGDDIVIQVIAIKGDRVRLGIQAPHHVEVDRQAVRESKIKTGRYTPNRNAARPGT